MKLLDAAQFDDPALHARDPQVSRFVSAVPGTIGNVTTQMRILDTGTHLFPVSVNDGDDAPNNSYVVSPLTAYTGYADYELERLGRTWLTWPLRSLTKIIGKRLKAAHLDRIVQVNNWLLSTNLYPGNWHGTDLSAVTRLLVDAYPDHAIGFRSLNRHSNPELIDQLYALGYLSLPSRQVYLLDARLGAESPFLTRRDNRRDAKLLADTTYRIVLGRDINEHDFIRLEHLYNLLYLNKYCPLNPQFSADWLRCGLRDGWLELTALRSPTGSLDGVVGWFTNGHILTTPVVGYDIALPQTLGLYRLLCRIRLNEAVRRRCLLNLSAGAAQFKRLRGGLPEIEYSLVYVGHLPAARRRVWQLLEKVLHTVGVPIMRKIKL